MPRVSNGRPLAPQTRTHSRPANRKAPRNHTLSALAVAEKQNPTEPKLRQHRLGEIEDGGERASKRRKTDTGLDDFGEADSNSGSDGDKWHVGVESGDDDSDLDSDEAMGESDEERFEGFAFRGSASQPSRKPNKIRKPIRNTVYDELDLSDGEADEVSSEDGNEDEEEDELEKDGVDLATALDLDQEEKKRKRQKSIRKSITTGPPNSGGGPVDSSTPLSSGSDTGDEEGSVNGEDSDSEEDGVSKLSLSDDNDEYANTRRLRTFVEGLQEQDATSRPDRNRPRSNIAERSSDFAIKPTQKLTIADLLPTVTDPGLRQSLKMLHNSETKGPQTYKGGIPGKLAPPLAKRQQDRLDRAAAYEKSKETLNRWIDTVKQNRRAEHISFPLPDPDALSAPGSKELMPTTQSQPLTSLESTIQNIMQESGLASVKAKSTDDQFRGFEDLQGRTIPIEEVQARRVELRKARELMFREEVRARRVKKIKSKSYRRVHRKERDKIAQEEHAALAAADALNSDEEREKNDRQRAEARMGARHRESKWAKGVKAAGRAAWDDDARAGVTDLARRDEELRKRIEGRRIADAGESESELSATDSDDDMTSMGSEDGFHLRLEQKLCRLGSTDELNDSKSNLASMAFMQRAESSRKAANDAEIELLRRELAGEGADIAGPALPESTGRLRFGSQSKPKADMESIQTACNEFEERLSEDGDADKIKFEVEKGPRAIQPPSKSKLLSRMSRKSASEQRSNPWLSNTHKQEDAKSGDGDISRSKPVLERHAQKAGINTVKSAQTEVPPMVDDDTSSSGSDEEDAPPQTVQPALSRNEELVQMTFAGDEVFNDFNKEKEEAVKEEGDQIIDNAVPGWGSWAGAGISKRQQKRNEGRLVTTIKGVQEEKRKDAKLDRVIVNEKRVKKVRLCLFQINAAKTNRRLRTRSI